MDWENGEDNIGRMINTANIITTSNEAGVNETKEDDNLSKAEVIIAIGTGETTYIAITAGLVIVLIVAGVVIWRKKK